MDLARCNAVDRTVFGLIEKGQLIDVSREFDSFKSLLEAASTESVEVEEGRPIDLSELTYLPPTEPDNAVFALALNYRSHVDETDMAIPERPLVFQKLYRSLVGHEESITYHTSETQRIDYEAELAAVIGRPARHVSEDEALDYVAGYSILNDISARDIQRMTLGDDEVLDWFSAKAMQNTTPFGPYVRTSDSVGDPQDLHIESRYNGDVMQDEATGLMIRSVAELVSFISTRVELQPGDVIATGTPEGVGEFQDISLEDGDRVEITIDGVGTLSNPVKGV